jgi:predicted phage terminase large subunit-like protein
MSKALAQKQLSAEELAYSSLLCYMAMQWPHYIISRHNKLIAEKLEAVERREITRLLITAPPRHSKTMTVVEGFGSWYFGRNPTHQIIYTTFSSEKAEDHGLAVKNLMLDENYPVIFPDSILAHDSKAKSKLATTQGGHFFSVGVGGAIVGRGADLYIMDDLLKSREEADSPSMLRKIEHWYRSVVYTRLMPNAVMVFITTRWNKDDLAGVLLRSDQRWELLELKAVCEDTNKDPLHREVGEALWPDRYPIHVLEDIKQTIQTREWTAQYQQNPVDEEGGIIKYDWLKRYDKKPDSFDKIVQSWDTAFSKNTTNAPSVCLTFGQKDHYHYWLHTYRGFIDYPTLKKKVVSQYNDFEASIVLVEDRASGQSLVQDLKSETGIPIKGIYPKGSKEQRLSSESGSIESGSLLLPESAPWLTDTITELIAFPTGKYKDVADALSQYLRYSRSRKIRANTRRFWK